MQARNPGPILGDGARISLLRLSDVRAIRKKPFALFHFSRIQEKYGIYAARAQLFLFLFHGILGERFKSFHGGRERVGGKSPPRHFEARRDSGVDFFLQIKVMDCAWKERK